MAKKRRQHPKMVMKADDIAYRRRLLERWGFLCVICGREFAHLACVTKEHIVPKSAPAHLKPYENLALSHHACNELRGAGSILAAAKAVDEKAWTMPAIDFHCWLNRQVPHRIVPSVALMPVRVPRFLELAESLPGMS